MPATFVEGWTGAIALTLKSDGNLVDLSGSSQVFRLFDQGQNEILESGALNVTMAVSGAMQYEPATGDFLEALSPYYIRIEVTDALGDVTFFPSDAPDTWTIRGVSG